MLLKVKVEVTLGGKGLGEGQEGGVWGAGHSPRLFLSADYKSMLSE